MEIALCGATDVPTKDLDVLAKLGFVRNAAGSSYLAGAERTPKDGLRTQGSGIPAGCFFPVSLLFGHTMKAVFRSSNSTCKRAYIAQHRFLGAQDLVWSSVRVLKGLTQFRRFWARCNNSGTLAYGVWASFAYRSRKGCSSSHPSAELPSILRIVELYEAWAIPYSN